MASKPKATGVPAKKTQTKKSESKKPEKIDSRDEYGTTEGTANHMFINALRDGPKTMKEIKQLPWAIREGHRPMTFYTFFKTLVKKGLGEIGPDKKMHLK